MKKVLDWANKFPKNLPLILIGVYFVVSLISSSIGIRNGTMAIFSVMTLIQQCIIAFIVFFVIYQTDKKVKNGQLIKPYTKLIWIVLLSIFALSNIGMSVLPLLSHADLNAILSILKMLIYVFACLLSLSTVLSWETTESMNTQLILKTIGIIACIAVVITTILALAPIKDCQVPKCYNKTGVFSKYCSEHAYIINNRDKFKDPEFIYDTDN